MEYMRMKGVPRRTSTYGTRHGDEVAYIGNVENKNYQSLTTRLSQTDIAWLTITIRNSLI